MSSAVKTFRHKLRTSGGSTLYTSLSKKATLKLKKLRTTTGMTKREIVEEAINRMAEPVS